MAHTWIHRVEAERLILQSPNAHSVVLYRTFLGMRYLDSSVRVGKWTLQVLSNIFLQGKTLNPKL